MGKEFESIVEKSCEEQKSAMKHVIHLTKEIDLREQKIESMGSEIESYEAVKVKNKQEQEFLTCRIVKLEQEEQNSKTARNLFLQQVATLEDSLESTNITNRGLSSQIKLCEEKKAEQIELHEADKVKIEQEQESLTCRISEFEQEKRNNRTEQDLVLQEAADLKNDLESTNTKNLSLSSQIKSYEEVNGEHERFVNELQSSLERNDQLSIDIESFRI